MSSGSKTQTMSLVPGSPVIFIIFPYFSWRILWYESSRIRCKSP